MYGGKTEEDKVNILSPRNVHSSFFFFFGHSVNICGFESVELILGWF